MKPRTFATLFGTKLQISRAGLISSAFLFLIFLPIALLILRLPVTTAVVVTLLALLIHWLNTFAHHLGHAAAAQHTGYPMELIRTWYFLCGERYPADEPELAPAIHIRRALGGPIVSLVLSLLGVAVWWLGRPSTELGQILLIFFTLSNFFVYFLGSLLPLGFTDGSTLIYWTRQQKAGPS